jgi:hypothetical protein
MKTVSAIIHGILYVLVDTDEYVQVFSDDGGSMCVPRELFEELLAKEEEE